MKVAIYARVSTLRQAENELSIPDQLNQLRGWVQDKGHYLAQEYIEPGASAIDDKRPIFQSMIQVALSKDKPFDIIVVHSLSRFFRDCIEFGLYERKLKRNDVKIISITQQTPDDDAGEMMRRMFNNFDEYQSKENAKHTKRAMKENARQGFFNGSRAPYGYKVVESDVIGRRGRNRKKLAMNDHEAEVVKMIFNLYLHGDGGIQMGCKAIAMQLNRKGIPMRGKTFGYQKIHNILSNPLYMGEYIYNMRDSKAKKQRAPEEWVKTDIPPIIDAQLFELVKRKRETRSPKNVPAKRIASPQLLSGLIKCGHCGSHMTTATGKSGRYKYYKCTNKLRKGAAACNSRNLPMEKTDKAVIQSLCKNIFEPTRLQNMLQDFRKQIQADKSGTQEKLKLINHEMQLLESRHQRLLDAIETGVLDLDETTQNRVQALKRQKEALIIEKTNLGSQQSTFDLNKFKASQVESLSKKLSDALLSTKQEVAKAYLNLLVDEVKVHDTSIDISGGVVGMIMATTGKLPVAFMEQVPTSIIDWRPRRDSNALPAP